MQVHRWTALAGAAALLLCGCNPTSSGPTSRFPDRFSQVDLRFFFDAAAQAEAISDPLRRCLRYPDPTGSRWSVEVVKAYCQYISLPIPSQAEFIDLIEHGHAEELDRRLGEVVRRQSDPDMRGWIDRIYIVDFAFATPQMRTAIESWKEQRPRSAFAFAAGGAAHLGAAWDARGGEAASKTSVLALAGMHRELDYANADFAAAKQLDPTLVPIYFEQIEARMLAGGWYQLHVAIADALRVAPSDLAVRLAILQQARPMWLGSVRAMQSVANDAKAHAVDNPLLLLLDPAPEAEAADLCGCDGRSNPADYRRIFDHIAHRSTMTYAVVSAELIKRDDLAVVYRSEALRFTENPIRDHSDRLAELSYFGNLALQTDSVIRLARNDAGYLFENATDMEVLKTAGQTVAQFRQWDSAWAIAQKMIRLHPDSIDGWIIQAAVQQQQPRPGLRETADYIIKHFSNDPKAAKVVETSQQMLALTAAPGSAGVPAPAPTQAKACTSNDSFEARVKKAKLVEDSPASQEYQRILSLQTRSYVPTVMQVCLAKGPHPDPPSFTLIADILPSGALACVEVRPITNVSQCFATGYAREAFPKSPDSFGKQGVPIEIEMNVPQ